jgi:hypothetical protein
MQAITEELLEVVGLYLEKWNLKVKFAGMQSKKIRVWVEAWETQESPLLEALRINSKLSTQWLGV